MPSEHRLLFQIRKNKNNNKKKIVGHSAACIQMLLQSALEKTFFLWNWYKTAALITGPVPTVHCISRVQQMDMIIVDRINSN